LGGSTIFSPEQMIIDLEVLRRCKRLSLGIGSENEKWLGEVISSVGSGGNYLTHPSTRKLVRSNDIYFSRLGSHGSYEQWVQAGSPNLLDEIGELIQTTLSNYQPEPLPDPIERELAQLEKKARMSE
jgi:trimethylamine--corrinoid protein Co-methyltransferase